MPAAAPATPHRPRPALRQLRRDARARDRSSVTLPAPATVGGSASSSCARCPAAGGCRPSRSVRSTWRTPARTTRCPTATRSRSCRRWPEAEHGLPDRPTRSISPALLAAVQSPERGGVAVLPRAWCGITTTGGAVLRLDYSAYGPMAEAECARIVAEAEARWPVAVALRHGSGRSRSATPPSRSSPRRRTATRRSRPAATSSKR